MILTVCPSPCIDINMEVDSFSVGKTNRIISKKTFYTGKAFNIAVGLARLDARVFATGFMYEENGAQFERELHREGVSYKFVWNKGRVRENYKFIDRKSMLTEVDDVSSEISSEKQEELYQLIAQLSPKCEAVVISGGLAMGMNADFYYNVLNSVPSEVIKVADTEGERLIQSLKCGVKLVKPNLEELERTLNCRLGTKEDIVRGCNVLLDKGAEIVLLSLGKKGAIITDGRKCYHCKSVNVAMNSTVGAGDAMVAAATNTMVKGGDLKEILRCGVAGGTAAVTLPDSVSFTKDKYEEILSSLTVQKF